MTIRRTAHHTAVLAAASALVLAGCQGLTGDEDAEFGEPGSGEQGEPTAEETTPEDADDQDPEDSTGDPPAGETTEDDGPSIEESSFVRGPEDAIETMTYDPAVRDLESVTVGLHSLRVEDDVMLLELSFTPEGGSSTYGFNNFNQGRALVPVLNDRENLKQYRVIGSGGNRWASDSTTASTQIESGQTVMFHAYYAAPEDDIETINVSVIEGLVEFEDVEIER